MSKLVFFTADDGTHGRELWVTDGTPQGTQMVRDILPGPWSSGPDSLAALPDGRIVFRATDEAFSGAELWASDGTEDGTVKLKDIGGEFASGDPREMTPLGDGRIVFSARAGRDMPFEEAGRELWVTDGTAAGTTLLKNIRPDVGEDTQAPLSSNPVRFLSLPNGKVLFTADDGIHGREPWVTDGTADGTQLLADLNPGPGGSDTAFRHTARFLDDGRLQFSTRYETPDGSSVTEQWVTDGTPGGTRPYDPPPSPPPPEPVRPPGPFERGIGEGAYPTDSAFRGAVFDESRSIFTTTGKQHISFDELLGLDLAQRTAGRLAFEARSDPGVRLNALLTGSEDEIVLQGRSFEGHVRFELQNPTQLGEGPVSIAAVSPALQVTVPEGVSVSVTYTGGAGSVTQDFGTMADGERWLAPNDDTMLALGAGPISVTSVTGESDAEGDQPPEIIELPYRVAEITGIIGTGIEPWVTDGTEQGTRLLADINPGYYGSRPALLGGWQVEFKVDGKLLFTARDGSELADDPSAAGLWATDGTPGGTTKLADAPYDLQFYHPSFFEDAAVGGGVLISDQRNELWVTDGTPGGTALVAEGIEGVRTRAVEDVGDGRALFLIRGTEGGPSALWVTDGTVNGTVRVAEDVPLPWMESSVLLDRDTLINSVSLPAYGNEPVAFDLANGGMVMLADANPGASSSFPRDWVLAMPDALRVPVSTLFDTRVTLLGEAADAFDLDRYFTDPQGGRLDYTVTGQPEGVTWDPGARQISAAPDAAPGQHEITIAAESATGGRTSDSFAWDLVDTGLLRLETTGGWGRETRDSPITLEPGSTLHIGRKDGNEQLLRIEEAEATIDYGTLTVRGQLYADQFPTTLPLMQGGFTIDMDTLAVSDFEDQAVAASHMLVGDLIELTFTDIALRADGVVLRTDLGFGDAFGDFSTDGGLLALELSDAGPSFGLSEMGAGRWFTDRPLGLPLPAGAPFSLSFSDLGMNYDFLTDSIYLMGKASLTWGETVAASFSFLSDSTTSKLTIDLAGEAADDPFQRGDKFLRIGRDDEGWNWDIVGEIKYEGQEGAKPLPGRPFIEEMSFSLDTVEKEFGGGFKGTMPTLFKGLTLEAEVGATWDPAAIDSFSFGLDGLNKPLGATGLFVQGGKLAAENLTAQDPDDWPVLSAQLGITLGPVTELTPAPVRGHLGGAIAGAEVTLDIEAVTQVGYLLPGAIERIAAPMIRWLGVDADDVLEYELMKLAGDLTFDFADPFLVARLGASFMGDLITGEAGFTAQTLGDVVHLDASVSAVATFPDALPLIGGLSQAGHGLVRYSADDNDSNDSVTVWSSFSVPFDAFGGSASAGVRLWFDGRYELMSYEGIDAIGSWELGPELELVILSAQWENASDSARLELIAPGGTVLTEADFGDNTGLAAGIALVEDLTSPTGRHVALLAPAAGIWDVQLVDETGLGAVRYEASEMLQGAQAVISDVTIAPGAREGVIALDLAPGDTEEIALTLFVSQTPEALSGLNVIEAVVPANAAGALSFDWDFAALASGSWWLHARAEGDGLAPQVAMFDTPIEVTGAADLAVTLDQQPAAGGASVLSVRVQNLGDIASGAGRLDLTVPEAVLDAPALPDAAPLTQAVSEIALQGLAPGESLRFDFALPAGLGPMVQPVVAEVSSPVYDADMENNTDALFLAALSVEREGVVITRGGAAMAGVEVEAVMPDGSAITTQSAEDGSFSLAGLPPGAGMVKASHGFQPDHARITAGDALDALRIAVGLEPSFGPAGPMDFIAADVARDGQVTAGDALDILRVAVGLPTPNAPQWVFLDAAADLSGITAGNVAYQQGIDLSGHPGEAPLDMTAILLGNMIAPV